MPTVSIAFSFNLDHVNVLIRIHEYMCRFLLLFTHYCYADTDFLASRNDSLNKWYDALITLYSEAIRQSAFVASY